MQLLLLTMKPRAQAAQYSTPLHVGYRRSVTMAGGRAGFICVNVRSQPAGIFGRHPTNKDADAITFDPCKSLQTDPVCIGFANKQSRDNFVPRGSKSFHIKGYASKICFTLQTSVCLPPAAPFRARIPKKLFLFLFVTEEERGALLKRSTCGPVFAWAS